MLGIYVPIPHKIPFIYTQTHKDSHLDVVLAHIWLAWLFHLIFCLMSLLHLGIFSMDDLLGKGIVAMVLEPLPGHGDS